MEKRWFMVRVYKRREFYIYAQDGYIVHNTKKEFQHGHTHINNFNTAKYLIKMSIQKLIPYHASSYLLESLIRLSNDPRYTEELKKVQAKQKRKIKKEGA